MICDDDNSTDMGGGRVHACSAGEWGGVQEPERGEGKRLLLPHSAGGTKPGAELQGMLYMLQHTLRCYDVQE